MFVNVIIVLAAVVDTIRSGQLFSVSKRSLTPIHGCFQSGEITEYSVFRGNDRFCDAHELLKHPTEMKEKREKEKNEGRCAKCHKRAPRKEFLRCSRCQLAMYCDKTCQKGDWKDHKRMCNLMSVGREEMMGKREKKEKKGKNKKKKKRKDSKKRT